MRNNAEERHEMILARKHSTHVGEWYCPICGRRILLQWPPNYKKIVLEPGDEFVEHTGSYCEVDQRSPEVMELEDDPVAEDSYLAPFEEWLESQDTEDWWPDGG